MSFKNYEKEALPEDADEGEIASALEGGVGVFVVRAEVEVVEVV